MRIWKEETRAAFVFMSDILKEPELYPEEVVRRLKCVGEVDVPEANPIIRQDFVYGIRGYIIRDNGIVGLRPGASDTAKKEWMNYWENEADCTQYAISY